MVVFTGPCSRFTSKTVKEPLITNRFEVCKEDLKKNYQKGTLFGLASMIFPYFSSMECKRSLSIAGFDKVG